MQCVQLRSLGMRKSGGDNVTYITFENSGLIDLRSIKTFGVSVKENDSPIGFFGTGLKYAIAIALREGEEVGLLHGKKHYRFALQSNKIRNKEFQFITMNGEELSFTTELGKNWELWMAFRELYCNALDEGGDVEKRLLFPKEKENSTIFYLHGPKSESVYNKMNVYFLKGEPIWKEPEIEVYSGKGFGIYYKGILVKDLLGMESLFTYNILNTIDLTEDRTAKYSFELMDPIKEAILKSHDEEFIYETLTAPVGSLENGLNFTSSPTNAAGGAFNEVCLRLRNHTGKNINRSALSFWERGHRRAIVKEEQVEPSSLERMMLTKAIRFCTVIGFPIDKYPITIHKSLGAGILGEAHKGTILLSREAFKIGTKMVAETLVEEYIHLEHGHKDLTRGMQNLLFNTIVNLAEEHILKEPL